MSFENEQYVSSRMDRVEALEQEITRLKQQLEEAFELLKITNTYCGGYTPASDFLAKYRGGVNEYIKSMSNMWE